MNRIERRITHQLVNYWQAVKGDRILPAEWEIDADELGASWEDCFLFQLRPGATPDDVNLGSYGHIGDNLHAVFVHQGTEEYLVTLPPDALREAYRAMMMTQMPVVDEVEEFRLDGRFVRYRQCLLPLGTPEGGIRAILGGMRFRYI